MTWRDAIRLAVSALRGGIVRTVLTILGLGVGVGAVLTVLTLGSAGEVRVENEIVKLGVNKVWVRAGDSHHALAAMDAARMSQSTGAPACAGAYTLTAAAMGRESAIIQVAGFDESMTVVHAPKLLEGRLLMSEEFQQGSAVCLVDEALNEHFGGEVVGRFVTLANRRMRVVGVIKNMAMQALSGGNGMLLISLRTFMDTFDSRVAEITLSVQQGQDAQQVADGALLALGVEDGFRADTLENEINAAREVVRIFVMVLVCVAFVCMLTGGIGILNVLYLSVRERRREIGLIKAVGGTAGQVGVLFLLEAAVYALLGGVLGVVLGAGMIRLFGAWIGLETGLTAARTLPVLIGAGALGVGFGVAPAVKAAGLQPVDALRSE